MCCDWIWSATLSSSTCEPNESSLQCEDRIFNPSIAIVSLEENWGGKTADDYEGFLRTILDYLINEGVLPILATKADNFEGDHSINLTIIKLATEYEVPLWNFWLAVQPLPNHGLRDSFYLTYDTPHFDNPENMSAAWPWRNLTALQAIDAVWNAVSNQWWTPIKKCTPRPEGGRPKGAVPLYRISPKKSTSSSKPRKKISHQPSPSTGGRYIYC